MELKTLKKHFRTAKKVTLTSHLSPDADAIGSCVGLREALLKKGMEVYIIVPDAYPDFLDWMDEDNEIMIFDKQEEKSLKVLSESDIVFSLDYNKLSRVGDGLGEAINSADCIKVMIDHHRDPDDYPDYTISDVNASSTAELICRFLIGLGWFKSLSLLGAEALYAGIMTDTGNFRFNSTSENTHKTAAKLLSLGVKGDTVYSRIYDQNSINRLKLLGHVLDQRMKVFPELNAVYFWLPLEDKKQFNVQKGDTEGFVNYGLSVKGMVFSTFITEDEDKIKFSFRSKGDFSVHEFATNFNGGGHFNAAGGRLSDVSLNEAIKKFEEELYKKADLLNKPFKA